MNKKINNQKYINNFNCENLTNLSTNLQKKIVHYYDNHELFIKMIYEEKYNELENLLEKGYPCVANSFFNEDDFQEMGDSLSDDIDNIYHPHIDDIYQKIHMFADHQKLLSLMAKYLIYKNNMFANTYFAHTNDYQQASQYITTFYESLKYRHNEACLWIGGAIYNQDNDFFQIILSYHKKLLPDLINILYPISARKDTAYNTRSWIQYYDIFFSEEIKGIKNSIDPINEAFSRLTRQYYLSEKVSYYEEIDNFILKKYEQIYGIKDPILYDIAIINHELNKINHYPEVRSNSYKNLKLKSKEKELKIMVDKALASLSHQDCFEGFKKIGLSIEYYKKLESYIKIDKSTAKNNILISKINKI